MMTDVLKADIIIANEIHYTVALQYDNQKMQALKVLAKGAGLIALNIRQLAEENRIPVLEASLWQERFIAIAKSVVIFRQHCMLR